MPNTQTVTEFLSARIAEERERAEGAKWAMGPSWFVADPASRVDTYVASLNPDRTLADLAAKQWLIDRVGVLDDGTADQRRAGMKDEAEYACLVFASAYADHPDYRAEWRP
ncbi:hypothetical protein FHX52_0419 [Humibacillus xanthopallidus]|uniref:Uncharacterized protein n=1 Tax=Humibacillus xanthopallidus TaxID=412689 RepID=A0A543PTE2_9MICO|nr:DUF6221 family protein [Humibacillus xanthopallidus]TQN47326.1 hypothetical protein FHX52_0419 [Humibacillus xanthopallidus]